MRDRDITRRSSFTATTINLKMGCMGASARLARELGISRGQLANHLAGRRYRPELEAWLHARLGVPYVLPPAPLATVRARQRVGNPGPRGKARPGAPPRAVRLDTGMDRPDRRA